MKLSALQILQIELEKEIGNFETAEKVAENCTDATRVDW
jgi:hypothetical protein